VYLLHSSACRVVRAGQRKCRIIWQVFSNFAEHPLQIPNSIDRRRCSACAIPGSTIMDGAAAWRRPGNDEILFLSKPRFNVKRRPRRAFFVFSAKHIVYSSDCQGRAFGRHPLAAADSADDEAQGTGRSSLFGAVAGPEAHRAPYFMPILSTDGPLTTHSLARAHGGGRDTDGYWNCIVTDGSSAAMDDGIVFRLAFRHDRI